MLLNTFRKRVHRTVTLDARQHPRPQVVPHVYRSPGGNTQSFRVLQLAHFSVVVQRRTLPRALTSCKKRHAKRAPPASPSSTFSSSPSTPPPRPPPRSPRWAQLPTRALARPARQVRARPPHPRPRQSTTFGPNQPAVFSSSPSCGENRSDPRRRSLAAKCFVR